MMDGNNSTVAVKVLSTCVATSLGIAILLMTIFMFSAQAEAFEFQETVDAFELGYIAGKAGDKPERVLINESKNISDIYTVSAYGLAETWTDLPIPLHIGGEFEIGALSTARVTVSASELYSGALYRVNARSVSSWRVTIAKIPGAGGPGSAKIDFQFPNYTTASGSPRGGYASVTLAIHPFANRSGTLFLSYQAWSWVDDYGEDDFNADVYGTWVSEINDPALLANLIAEKKWSHTLPPGNYWLTFIAEAGAQAKPYVFATEGYAHAAIDPLIEIAPEHREYFTITTEEGLFDYARHKALPWIPLLLFED